MKKLLTAWATMAGLCLSTASFAGTLVINTDTSDPAPKKPSR